MDSCQSLPISSIQNVFEAGTGAVRSNDLAKARWDLISGASTRWLVNSSTLVDYRSTPVTLVNEAIDYAHRFLGCEHESDDTWINRLSLLGRGWWKLAAAIQILDSTPEQLELLNQRVSEDKHYPYWALRRLAYTCHEGMVKYAAHNWLHGFQVSDLMNHGIHHMTRWTNGFGIRTWGEKAKDNILNIHGVPIEIEDELGHSMWSFMGTHHMMHFRSNDMCQFLLGQNYSITPKISEMHDKHASRKKA